MQPTLLASLTGTLEASIRDANPWWRGERLYGLPPFRRWAFEPVLKSIESGLAPGVVLRGPRQIGKTTLLNQVIDHLLDRGVAAHRIFRVQFDELPELRRLASPILESSRWYSDQILRKSFHQAANNGEQAFIFLDEVQNLPDWAPQLKHLVDMNPVRVLVTGSSALRIEAGRDSLAGRISTFEMGPMLLREIAELRGFGRLEPVLTSNGPGPLKEKQTWLELVDFGRRHQETRDQAFLAFSQRGAYPLAHARVDQPWELVADLRTGPRGQKRDEHLLEEVFRLACRYVGQAPSQALYLNEIRHAMSANIGGQRLLAYLTFLDATLLLRLIEPLELRLKRRRGPPKICLCDHALRAAWLQEVVPIAPEELDRSPHLATLAGHIAESTVGYFFRSLRGLDVAHFPERAAEPEVDFILTVGEQRIPVEVKYRRRIAHQDSVGIRSFLEKSHYNAPFGVLVTLTDEPGSEDPRIVSLSLASLLLLR